MANFVSRHQIISWIDSIGKPSVTKEEIIEWVDSVERSVSKEDIDDWIVTYTNTHDVYSFMDGFEDAFIGLVKFPGEDGSRALYDEDKCVEILWRDLGREWGLEVDDEDEDFIRAQEEAVDAFYYSTMRAIAYDKHPPGFLLEFNINIISEG